MEMARVGLAKAGDRRTNVYRSLDLIREDVECQVAEQVLLKPNFLSNKNQLASTHPDAIRGAIDFLLSTPTPPKEIIIAEGGNEDFSGETFANFGYPTLQDHDGQTGHLYGARTTPHLFVIDREGLLRYSGALDDNPRGNELEPTNYILQVVGALHGGQTPPLSHTTPYGCSVKYAN